MTNLSAKLAAAQDEVARIQREIAAGPCREFGHDFRFIGGCNAGCELGAGCGCSVPVHECTKCGDCDYGDNDEAASIRAECADNAPLSIGEEQ